MCCDVNLSRNAEHHDIVKSNRVFRVIAVPDAHSNVVLSASAVWNRHETEPTDRLSWTGFTWIRRYVSAITTETAVKVTVLLLTEFSGNAPSVLWWAKYVEMSAASSLKIPGKATLFQKKFPPHNTNKEIRILRVAYFIRMNFLLLHSVDYTYLWRWITSWRSWSHPRISGTKRPALKVTSTRSSSSFLASLIDNSSVSSTKIVRSRGRWT